MKQKNVSTSLLFLTILHLLASVFFFYYGRSVISATKFLAINNKITLNELIRDINFLWILFSSAVLYISLLYFFFYIYQKK
ncbi:MAG: hypothetical protein A2Z88_01520 [Omnitrophica WOR_2 bacterium GWA2_47_8]|nr:MAG: hypothetical protein A2Z88_01520 [Omnitrophica WOR_2 bacterium GWA2_47_8]